MENIHLSGIELYDEQINEKEKNLTNQNKDITTILQNLLKKNLDKKILNLEKNAKKHFSMLNTTLTNTNYLIDLTSSITKEVQKIQNYNQKTNKSKSVKRLNLDNNNLELKESSTFSNNRPITKRSVIKPERKNTDINPGFHKDNKRIKLDSFSKEKNKKNKNKNEFIFKSPTSLKRFMVDPDNGNNNNNNNNKSKLNTINNSSLNKYISSSTKTNNKHKAIIHKRSHNSMDSNLANMTFENSNGINNNNLKVSKHKGSSVEQTTYKKSSNKNKKLGLIGRLKRSIDKVGDKITTNKKGSLIKDKKEEKSKNKGKSGNKSKVSFKNKNSKTISENSNNINNNKTMRNSSKKKKESDINKNMIITNLEKNWKKEENLIDKDPLLITAMTDLEFIPKDLFSINISRDELSMYINKNKDSNNKDKEMDNSSKISNEKIIKLENSIFDEHLPNIIIFLNKIDIIQFKNCSKSFHTLIINYFIKTFDKEKINFMEKQNKLNLKEEEKNQKLDMKNLILNKGTIKAIKLLNDEIFCRLFSEEKIPIKDILLVYKVYFQLINYKEITDLYNNESSDNDFWNKCRNYFRNNSGKISELLNENINENKIIITGENLYKVFHLIEKDIHKFCSGYFSKLCGTTSIFIFYIKDILDFLGFSNDTKFQNNSYYCFSEILNYIDFKIKSLNDFLQKYSCID